MALQTTGAITLAEIQTEFGGSNPISLSEYYAGGTYVPSGASGTNGAVPASGQISMSQFYGTSDIVILSFTGNQTWVVPTGVTSVTVKCWGAGGAHGASPGTFGKAGLGGEGGFAKATISVTPGETLYVHAGTTGSSYSAGNNGAGAGINVGSNFYAGGGGGYSAVFRPWSLSQANALVMAGGGGGGATGDSGSSNNTECSAGGKGGGGNGTASLHQSFGEWTVTGGDAGTTIAGGAAGTENTEMSLTITPTAGSALQGGNGGWGVTPNLNLVGAGGGAGGGYYGGGGGCAGGDDYEGWIGATGGGGGSGKVTGTNTFTYQGLYTSDPDYNASYGGPGENGRIVITY
jgi:hypothetical protein